MQVRTRSSEVMSSTKMFVPVNTPLITESDVDAVSKAMAAQWVSSEAPHVQEFENNFAVYHGRRYAVAVSSGTAALDIAVECMGLAEGDEVIMPAMTIISCLKRVLEAGARPVFVDSDMRDFNAIFAQVVDAISAKTRAIIIPHIFGLAVDIPALRRQINNDKIVIIEDAAEAMGLKTTSGLCGSMGDIAIFSFYANKHITTGEGGMLLTDNEVFAQYAASYRNLCFQAETRFLHEKLGWNYRMTAMQAALGNAQLSRIDEIMARKVKIGQRYDAAFAGLKVLSTPLLKNAISSNCYWVYPLVVAKPHCAVPLIQKLASQNIGTRPFFFPLNEQPLLPQNWTYNSTPNAKALWERGFYIPSGLGLTDKQIDYVIERVLDLDDELAI